MADDYTLEPVEHDPFANTGMAQFRAAVGAKPPTGPITTEPQNFPEFVAQTYGRALGDMFSTPGRAYQEGLTPEQEVHWAGGMGLSMMGAGAPFAPKGAAGVAGGKMIAPEATAPTVPPFYSAVLDTIGNAKQDIAHPAQWNGMIRNAPGVKPEEMEWIGLTDWLKGQGNRKVSREELADYVRGNQVEVREVNRGDLLSHDIPAQMVEPIGSHGLSNLRTAQDIADAKRFNVQFRESVKGMSDEDILAAADRLRTAQQYQPTKFGSYQLPGGENYRELLLTLPETRQRISPERQEYQQINDQIDSGALNHLNAAQRQQVFARRHELEQTVLAEGKTAFTSSHWDEPNVLAHVRFNDRTIDGKKTLFVEEIQSDWHQTGKKRGYQGQETPEQRALMAERDQLANSVADMPQGVGGPLATREYDRAMDRITEINQQLGQPYGPNKVPDAPFKTTWPELALKRMLRYAAENGYEQIAWTPGEVQAARYDLSKHINQIEYIPNRDGTYRVGVTGRTGDGVDIPNSDRMSLRDVENTFGKEIAEKFKATEGRKYRGHEGYMLEGLDLKVGGEGMAGFYDRMLPAAANKLGKKYGAKTEIGRLPADRPPYKYGEGQWAIANDPRFFETREAAERELQQPVHVMPITPALRSTALSRGFPLFQGGLPITFPGLNVTPVDHDPFAQGRAAGGRVIAHNINPNPTEAQKEAGNYAKDHVRVHGLDITIENAKGGQRRGVDKGGKPWSVKMPAHYGYIKRTEGKDGDHVDCYLGPHLKSPNVFIVDQVNADTREFDEHKCFIGFASKQTAINAYHKAFSDGRGHERLGHVTEMDIDQFKHWLGNGDTTKPADDHQAVKIVRRFDVPYLAGASNDGKTVYIDRRVPLRIKVRLINGKGFRFIDPAKPLSIHEIEEWKAMTQRKMPYLQAHTKIATPAEHEWLTSHGLDWRHYEEIMDGLLDHVEHEHPKRPPPDLYLKPYCRKERALLKREENKEAA